MDRRVMLLALAGSGASLAGCASGPPEIRATLNLKHRFDDPGIDQPKTYFMLRTEQQFADLGWREQAAVIRSALANAGLVEAKSQDAADVLVLFSVRITNEGSPGSTYIPPATVGGTSSFAKGFNAAAGGGQVVRQPDQYSTSVLITMYPRGTTTLERIEPLFQGFALTMDTKRPELTQRALLRSVLESFPARTNGMQSRQLVLGVSPNL